MRITYCLLVIEAIEVVLISESLMTLPEDVAACFHWYWAKLPKMPLSFSFLRFTAITVDNEGLFSACSLQGAGEHPAAFSKTQTFW